MYYYRYASTPPIEELIVDRNVRRLARVWTKQQRNVLGRNTRIEAFQSRSDESTREKINSISSDRIECTPYYVCVYRDRCGMCCRSHGRSLIFDRNNGARRSLRYFNSSFPSVFPSFRSKSYAFLVCILIFFSFSFYFVCVFSPSLFLFLYFGLMSYCNTEMKVFWRRPIVLCIDLFHYYFNFIISPVCTGFSFWEFISWLLRRFVFFLCFSARFRLIFVPQLDSYSRFAHVLSAFQRSHKLDSPNGICKRIRWQ